MQTLKKFIKYYKPYKAVFFIDLLCATIISAIDLAFPQLLRTLTKTLFAGAPGKIISALIPITIGLLVAYIIQTACRYYVTYAGHMMGARMERDMRKELFDQYENTSISTTRISIGTASIRFIINRKMNEPIIFISDIKRFSGP